MRLLKFNWHIHFLLLRNERVKTKETVKILWMNQNRTFTFPFTTKISLLIIFIANKSTTTQRKGK